MSTGLSAYGREEQVSREEGETYINVIAEDARDAGRELRRPRRSTTRSEDGSNYKNACVDDDLNKAKSARGLW